MLESMLGKAPSTGTLFPADTGPGPTVLVAGDNNEGFFGEVPVADFINGTALATAIGLTAGSVVAAGTNVNWLKFAWKNRVLMVPMGGYRSNLSWAQIYAAGAVYGSDDEGLYPSGTPRLQNARVTVAGCTYRVRLFKTSVNNTINLGITQGTGRYDDDVAFKNSEYNQLMYRSCVTSPVQQVGADWASYTLGQLSRGWIICQEVSSQVNTGHYLRGYYSFSIQAATSLSKSSAVASAVWHPVLELIPSA